MRFSHFQSTSPIIFVVEILDKTNYMNRNNRKPNTEPQKLFHTPDILNFWLPGFWKKNNWLIAKVHQFWVSFPAGIQVGGFGWFFLTLFPVVFWHVGLFFFCSLWLHTCSFSCHVKMTSQMEFRDFESCAISDHLLNCGSKVPTAAPPGFDCDRKIFFARVAQNLFGDELSGNIVVVWGLPMLLLE